MKLMWLASNNCCTTSTVFKTCPTIRKLPYLVIVTFWGLTRKVLTQIKISHSSGLQWSLCSCCHLCTKQYRHQFDHIKRVICSLGTNDHLYKDQHCLEDWRSHLNGLFIDYQRMFPNASVGFAVPFPGLPSIPQDYINFLSNEVKEVSPTVKRYLLPSMKKMVVSDSVHISTEGGQVLESFIRRTFLGPM